jgi:hypothetical protein
MGEYARCAAIARAVTLKWPDAGIHFVLSRAAPYAAGVPFPTTLLPSSPTFHSAAVIELMQSWRPQVVLFDNAGRTAQLKAARRLGARIVYISARRRQRRKAFRMRWMRLIDEHWIAYPKFIAGELNFLERLKLKLLRRPVVRYLDVILARAPARDAAAISSRSGCVAGNYVLVIPGGGTGHPGAAAAVEEFLAAAGRLAARGAVTVFVGPADLLAADASPQENLRAVGLLPQADLGLLMRGARLIVANGGSTLLQALACGAACVAVPIARDQAKRVRRCVDRGVAVASPLEAARMAEIAAALWDDEPARAALAQRAGGLVLADGVDVAVAALGDLIEPKLVRS